MSARTKTKKAGAQRLTAIDLFSGCGGLTLGLKQAGYKVLAAVESEELAAETYRANHARTKLYEKDIRELNPKTVMSELGLERGELSLLAGCPPCQGFSTLRTRNGGLKIDEPMNELVFEFIRFAKAIQPKTIMMENVPALSTDARIRKVMKELKELGYKCDVDVFDAADFGAPQRRKRMILIAAKKRKPKFAKPAARTRTVYGAIGKLPKPATSKDELHNYQVRRADHVMNIIRLVPADGGSRSELPSYLQLDCHKGFDGFKDIYGRMAWNEPSPTITGGCINPSKGRFLHPEQHRAITLREAALLQGFPQGFKFKLSKGRYPAAQMIGNAFPPIFARKHAAALRAYV